MYWPVPRHFQHFCRSLISFTSYNQIIRVSVCDVKYYRRRQSSSGEFASPSVSSQQRSAWSALMIAVFMIRSGGFSGSSSSASDTSLADGARQPLDEVGPASVSGRLEELVEQRLLRDLPVVAHQRTPARCRFSQRLSAASWNSRRRRSMTPAAKS